MKRRWDWYDRLLKNVLEFLDQRYPELGQRGCSIICDLQMSRIREKITRVDNEFVYYRSIVLRYDVLKGVRPDDHRTTQSNDNYKELGKEAWL